MMKKRYVKKGFLNPIQSGYYVKCDAKLDTAKLPMIEILKDW
jgi:hypothetical protein